MNTNKKIPKDDCVVVYEFKTGILPRETARGEATYRLPATGYTEALIPVLIKHEDEEFTFTKLQADGDNLRDVRSAELLALGKIKLPKGFREIVKERVDSPRGAVMFCLKMGALPWVNVYISEKEELKFADKLKNRGFLLKWNNDEVVEGIWKADE